MGRIGLIRDAISIIIGKIAIVIGIEALRINAE